MNNGENKINGNSIEVLQPFQSNSNAPINSAVYPQSNQSANPQQPVVPIVQTQNQNLMNTVNMEASPVSVEMVTEEKKEDTTVSNPVPPTSSDNPTQVPQKNGKYILTILLFIFLFALVYFLPNLSSYIALRKVDIGKQEQIITTGSLKCNLSKSTQKFDISYSAIFDFTDSQLKKLNYVVETRGDKSLDSDELQSLKDNCDQLDVYAKNISGISVSCSLYEGKMTNTQMIDYEKVNLDQITSVYAEAGGTYPEFKYNQSIDTIEKNMKASGYTCTRIH